MVRGIWQGIMAVRDVKHPWLFVAFTLGIWASYFLHYYLTFFCFEATSHLGMARALVTFIVGSIAVIVPTPNGAGPWHFAVKTMLILYGVGDVDALNFVLIVTRCRRCSSWCSAYTHGLFCPLPGQKVVKW